MKKLLLLAVAMLCMVGCKQTAKDAADSDEQAKVLVAYFSASGTTHAVAELLAQAANADLFEIQPEVAYTDADLDWRDSLSRSSVEMKDSLARPAIKGLPENLDQYTTIYVGFPIWWGVAPRVINTFLEAGQFEGKTIIPFATSGGSAIEPATDDLRAHYANLNIQDGCLLNDVTFEDLSQWVAEQQ